MNEFWTFASIGFVAQLIDSSLGMGFGIISNSVLLSQGVPPALASACVNAAKLPTTGAAALSHILHKNIDKRLVWHIAGLGAVGGAIGALVLTSLSGDFLKTLITVYMLFLGSIIVWRGLTGIAPKLLPSLYTRTIGFVGGIIEGIGGSWGPVVTTSLMGAGTESRYAIGTSNFSEFIVSISVFLTFVFAYWIGHWDGGADWASVAIPVLGLVAGGLPAAMFGGYLSKIAPSRPLTVAVGGLAVGIGLFRAFA